MEKIDSFNTPQFRNRIVAALANLVDAPEMEEDWKRFRGAYEFRAACGPWMHESGELPGKTLKDGLYGALEVAFAGFQADADTDSVHYQNTRVDDPKPVDETFRQRLHKAVTKLRDRRIPALRLLFEMERLEQDPATMTDQELSLLLKGVVEQYPLQARRGLTSDPW